MGMGMGMWGGYGDRNPVPTAALDFAVGMGDPHGDPWVWVWEIHINQHIATPPEEDRASEAGDNTRESWHRRADAQ